MTIAHSLGWAGMALYLVAYAYLGLRRTADRRRYFLANAVAAALVGTSSGLIGTWPSVAINLFWFTVSLLALAGITAGARHLTPRSFTLFSAVLPVTAAIAFFVDHMLAIALLGWTSAILFSGAYLLFAAGRLRARPFHLYNATAAAVILPQLWVDQNWPVMALEVCWFVLSCISALRACRLGTGLPAEIDRAV